MIKPLGPLVATGAPVAALTLVDNPEKISNQQLHGIMFQALATNLGKVYIGNAAMNKTTLANVYAVLAVPTTNTLPTFSAALTIAPNGLNIKEFWIDTDTSGEGALVSILVT